MAMAMALALAMATNASAAALKTDIAPTTSPAHRCVAAAHPFGRRILLPSVALHAQSLHFVQTLPHSFTDLRLRICSQKFLDSGDLCHIKSLTFNPLNKRSSLLCMRANAAPDDAVTSENPEGYESKAVGEGGSGSLVKTLQLGSLFGLWYLFNICFNIYNKQVLKAFTFPIALTEVQFAVGSLLVLLMWGLGIHKRPSLNKAQFLAILPLAGVHTLGNLFTNMSLGKVAVSFTHTIKAMEPFFSVILSAMFLGEVPNPWVVATLIPIVGGVALASITEASFNWAGFLSAMASNVTFQSRNVFSKKLMVKKEGSLDNINLFSVITILSFFLLAPAAYFFEGVKFTPTYLQSLGLNWKVVATQTLLASLCFHSYQQVSYMILQRVTPVTHSVGNCVKRVIVIITSVLFFKTPVSPINALGTGLALTGVFAYSRAKQSKSVTNKKAA